MEPTPWSTVALTPTNEAHRYVVSPCVIDVAPDMKCAMLDGATVVVVVGTVVVVEGVVVVGTVVVVEGVVVEGAVVDGAELTVTVNVAVDVWPAPFVTVSV